MNNYYKPLLILICITSFSIPPSRLRRHQGLQQLSDAPAAARVRGGQGPEGRRRQGQRWRTQGLGDWTVLGRKLGFEGKIWKKMEKIWKNVHEPPYISPYFMGKLRKTETENEGTLENWGGKKLKLPRSSRRVDIGWKSKITTKPYGK